MAFDITPYIDMQPAQVRRLIREGVIDFPTAGMCRGYAQANLVILPPEYAADFEEYTKKNPFPCPVLEVIKGTPETHDMGEGGNICTDIPRYRVYENGVFTKELTDASEYWKEGYVGFLIGCSFSFEEALMAAGIPVRHIEQGCNVPMFKTSIQTVKAGPFEGPMVCSMRPMTPEQAQVAYDITVKMPNVHGAPVQIGDPEKIGVKDVMKPDYGDPVEIREGEVPVFWPCGVTPQAAVENAKPPIVITHAPGHMFITDILNTAQGIATFLGETYSVTNEFDRMGCRLDGTAIEHVTDGNIISDGIAFGAIQVPTEGKPIIMMADRQTTGGYTKIANVISADFRLLGQLKAGDKVRFEKVSIQEAQQALLDQRAALRTLRRSLDM